MMQKRVTGAFGVQGQSGTSLFLVICAVLWYFLDNHERKRDARCGFPREESGSATRERRQPLTGQDKENITEYVCKECGLIHEVREPADANSADQWKLAALAGGGIVLLLLLWVWVFKYGVPLVRHISSIE